MGAGTKQDQKVEGLTPRQERFAREYVANGGNATKAAIAAGYSPKWADSQGPKLTGYPRIAELIAELQSATAQRLDITAERVLNELARIAFSRADQVLSFGPAGVVLKDSSGLSEDVLAAVAEANQTISDSGGSIKVKLHDKLGALEKLGKYLQLWGEREQAVSQFEAALAAMTEAQCIERAEALRAARLRAQADGG
jgi:phage terminase small subunit